MSSIRRDLIDEMLEDNIHLFNGRVLDVGGKKIGKRGKFLPPSNNIVSWDYLNLDEKTNPDIVADICSIPINDSTYDVVIATEVLEYIKTPLVAIKECHRVTKKGGTIILSTPFMHPIHNDCENDMYRFTKKSLEDLLKSASFSSINITEMGSLGAVFFDFLNISTSYASKRNNGYLNIFIQRLKFIFKALDRITSHQKEFINTGYFIILKK